MNDIVKDCVKSLPKEVQTLFHSLDADNFESMKLANEAPELFKQALKVLQEPLRPIPFELRNELHQIIQYYESRKSNGKPLILGSKRLKRLIDVLKKYVPEVTCEEFDETLRQYKAVKELKRVNRQKLQMCMAGELDMSKCAFGECVNKSGLVKLKRCSSCMVYAYCSVKCQRSHWKDHKIECEEIHAQLVESKLSHLI